MLSSHLLRPDRSLLVRLFRGLTAALGPMFVWLLHMCSRAAGVAGGIVDSTVHNPCVNCQTHLLSEGFAAARVPQMS
jgi:hypothetical protein